MFMYLSTLKLCPSHTYVLMYILSIMCKSINVKVCFLYTYMYVCYLGFVDQPMFMYLNTLEFVHLIHMYLCMLFIICTLACVHVLEHSKIVHLIHMYLCMLFIMCTLACVHVLEHSRDCPFHTYVLMYAIYNVYSSLCSCT